jgi:hypothetical protein
VQRPLSRHPEFLFDGREFIWSNNMTKRNRNFGIALLMLCLSITAHAMEKGETITLTDSKKIGYAMALNEAIDQVSKKVTECVEKKLTPPEKCFCSYPAEVSKVKEKYEVALKNNPEWRDRIVYWTVKGNPMSYNLAFAGLRRQVEMKCEKK